MVAQLAGHRLEGHEYVGALGDVMATHEPVFVGSGGSERAERVLRSSVALDAVRQLRHESLAVFPLLVDDTVVGMLTVARGPERPALAGAEAATAAEIAERASTALDHARSFGRVRDFSEQLQRTMLEDPVETEGLDIAVLYTPASQAARVGGDWYDSFVHPDGSTMLVVGDVIGHDSAAAAAMGQLALGHPRHRALDARGPRRGCSAASTWPSRASAWTPSRPSWWSSCGRSPPAAR